MEKSPKPNSNLQIYSKGEGLQESVKVFQMATSDTPMRLLDDQQLGSAVATIIEYIEALHGLQIPTVRYAVLVKLLGGLIRNYYSYLNLSEFLKAFELNVTGIYWTPVENYKNLDGQFFCKVLDAYKAYRNEMLTDYMKDEYKSVQSLPPSKMTEEEKIAFVMDCKMLYKNGIRVFPVIMLYEYMVLKGDFKEDDWKQFYDKAKAKISGAATKGEWFPKSFGELVKNTNLKEQIKSEEEVYEVVCLAKQMSIFKNFEQ